MIRLGLRLTLAGGREALTRLTLISLATALGVGMLLSSLAGINAVNKQNSRYAWLITHVEPHATSRQQTADPLWWLLSPDEYHGKQIGRVDLAATGPDSPVPPGIPRLPGPGQYYVSPALGRLLAGTPADQLAARFPGADIGTIGAGALPGPDALVIVVGHQPEQLAHVPGVTRVASFSGTSAGNCNGSYCSLGLNPSGIDLILSIVTAALLFPVLIFIGTATRLSAARREQRFAAMRLVGATPRQIRTISAVESAAAATFGTALGFAVFWLFRPVLTTQPLTGYRFYLGDVTLHVPQVLAVALGVPVASAVAARLALRRVTISPLGVTRRTTPRPPRAWRLIPLFAGLAELGYFVLVGRPTTTAGQIRAFLPGILVVMTGLIVAGPWLTMVGARLLSRRTRRPDVLIAGRRLADNPRAGFRAVSGLVLALFVASVAIAVMTTMSAYNGGTAETTATRGTLVDQLSVYGPDGKIAVPAVPQSVLSDLRTVPGVRDIALVHTDRVRGAREFAELRGLMSCADLARMPVLGRCAAGAKVVAVDPFIGDRKSSGTGKTWPAAAGVSPARLAGLPVLAVAVDATGAPGAVEQARTVLEDAYPMTYFPTTIAENHALDADAQRLKGYQRLVDVVIFASLLIAGSSLAVSVAAGLNDRKRPFALLRLSGTPVRVLRRVVALESAVPLVGMAVLSSGTGFLAAALFLRSQLSETLQRPAGSYYVIVGVGIVASLAIIASTLPLLERVTGPETARND